MMPQRHGSNFVGFWNFLLEIFLLQEFKDEENPSQCFMGLLGGGNDAKNFFSFSFGFGSSLAQCSQHGGNQGGLKGFWELIQSPGMVWVGRTQRPSNSNPFCLQNTALTQNLRFFPFFLPWNCCFSTKESHPDFPARLCSVPGRRNCWKFRNKNSLLRLWATNLGWNVALVVPIQFFFVFFSLPEKDLHKILRVFVCVSIVCAVISTPKKKKKSSEFHFVAVSNWFILVIPAWELAEAFPREEMQKTSLFD